MVIRQCSSQELDRVCDVINDAAAIYRDHIPADRWKEPYMPPAELREEVNDGVVFWGAFEDGILLGVMGLQHVGDVALVRHAYTRTASQGKGIGAKLLAHVSAQTDRPVLMGTWAAATWAIRFYEKHGFRLVPPKMKDALLRLYWTIPPRQIEESVVLADERWFGREG
ncbi:MAG TPA: GNAT family N-acetyltransferase [Gemmatimonadaceae bacterium]|jgi:GNAT superfamily N-acetyltransferase|nr:GNAT family N-acetyltransferase [Gemmatimonadaceae bacterium]